MGSRNVTRKEVVDILKNLEGKYAVDSWVIDEIHVWPLLKQEIFFKWFDVNNNKDNSSKGKKYKKNKLDNIIEIVVSTLYLIGLYLKRYKKLSIIFVGASSHRILYKDRFINRYFHPIIEHLEKNKKGNISIEYSERDSSKTYPEIENLIFIKKYLPITKVFHLFKQNKANHNINELSDFIKDVHENIKELNHIDFYKLLYAKVKLIKHYAFIYNIILKKCQPDSVICLCYYDTSVYALNYSAHKLGIETIDMQHGSQGELHVAYSNFMKVPRQGFNILPQTFWCWDKASAHVIQRWIKNQTFHDVKVSGNPWLSYSINSSEYSFPNKKIILYTMQFDEVEEFIIQAIRETPSNYEWWLRLHPRKLSARAAIFSMFKQYGLQDKIEIDKAIEYPLPHILNKSIVHISRFSGSVIEASEYGTRTIIIDEIGVETYKEFINSHQAVALLNESHEDLLKLIMEIEIEGKMQNNASMEKYKELIDRVR